MINKQILGTVIKDQLNEFKNQPDSVPRDILNKVTLYTGNSALIVKGIRRCGKSTLIKQLISHKFPDYFFYCNFDDDRLADFKSEDFQTLMEVLSELFGRKKVFFLDEVQNIKGWELFVNRLLRENYRVLITGSNANLLSKELGTHLTGRHLDIDLYPFSFKEFLISRKIPIRDAKFYSTEEKATLLKNFKEFINKGGMPEPVIFSNMSLIKSIINDIIQKDIIIRYNIRKPADLKSVITFFTSNISNLITVRSITDNFGISPNTIEKYLGYLEESYLFFTVKRFERKIKHFDKNPRKIYCVDNGIVTEGSPNIINKDSALLENLVALELKRRNYECYYYRNDNNYETDFVVPTAKEAIQVCYNLNEGNEKREVRGAIEGMKEIKSKEGLILTMDQEKTIKKDGFKIVVKPVWKWLLE